MGRNESYEFTVLILKISIILILVGVFLEGIINIGKAIEQEIINKNCIENGYDYKKSEDSLVIKKLENEEICCKHIFDENNELKLICKKVKI